MPDQNGQDELAKLQQLYEQGLLPQELYRAALIGLGVDPAAVFAQQGQQVGTQINVAGDLTITDPDRLWQAIRHRPPAQDLRQSTQQYLAYLVDRYRFLDLKGMGVSARVPLRLPLVEVYVPLEARVELPEGETWSRGLRLAGRAMPGEEEAELSERLSAPQPVLDLLRHNDGLIVLGDPGAGKTTFLKYLALGLATGQGERLNLGVHLPILVPLSAYANRLAGRDVRLDDFITGYFHDRGTDLPIDAMLREALAQGGALVLLDGLDEVQDPGLRQTAMRRVVDFYSFHRQAGNKFVLTSRVVGYRDVRPTVEGLAECTLVDFEDKEIESFVTQWTGTIERAARGDTPVAGQEAAREKVGLLAALQNNPGVRRLAANPLLLTILALMKRQGVTLPERRVELYDRYVRTLLSSWNRARGLGRAPARDLDVVETVRILAPLALWMHQVNPGRGLVKEGDLRRKLVEILRQAGEEEPERTSRRFLADVREHASLLLERGAGQYGFIHLTFEEYLAAVGVARLGQLEIAPVLELLGQHVGDPAWREVALLTVGYLGIVQQQEQVAGRVVGALLEREPGEPGQAVTLAGQAVVDAWPGGVTLACKEGVVRALVRTVGDDGRVDAPLRAEAGNALARLGDPRPGVGVDPETGLPDVVWCPIPGGSFLMGEGEAQHNVELPAYLISRYPITHAQFRAFVDAPDGYRGDAWWTQAGLQHRGRTGPAKYGGVFDLPNHPVVEITWYEAVAFCRWLTSELQAVSGAVRVLVDGEIRGLEALDREPFGLLVDAMRRSQCAVRLPSEAEWEKAARGSDGRRYPWGGDADPNRANYGDTGIGTTSAVGCFPGGASPYGCLDLAGNVWEWTSSLRRAYPYRVDDGREETASPDPRVLRGGAFNDDVNLVRCAVRGYYFPTDRDSYYGFRIVVSPISPPSAL